MKQATYKLFRYLRKAIAWLILLVLLLHAGISLLLSHSNYFLSDVESFLSKSLKANVSIRHLHSAFYFINPEIELTHLTIKNARHETTQSIQSLTLTIDLVASLRAHSLVLKQADIDHASIYLTKDNSGWHIDGIKKSNPHNNSPETLTTLLSIQRVNLENINIYLSDTQQKTTNTIAVQKLTAWKEKHKTFLNGKLSLNQSPVNVNAVIDTQPDKAIATGISAYVSSHALSIKPWLQLLSPQHYAKAFTQVAPISTQLWVQWQPNNWHISSQFNAPDTQLAINKTPLTIQQVKGAFWAKGSTLKHYSAQLRLSSFLFNHTAYSATDIFLKSTYDNNQHALTVGIPSINLGTLKKASLTTHLLPAKYQTILKTLKPRGKLHDTVITFYPDKKPFDFDATTTLKEVSVDAWQGAPSGKNISGHVTMNAHYGTIDIDSKNASLGLTREFNHPWYFDTVKGKFYWHLTKDNYTLFTPDTIFTLQPKDTSTSTPTTGHVKLKLDIPLHKHKHEHMSLEVNVDHIAATSAKQYIPFRILHEKLSKWLENSVSHGTITDAAFLWHGPLARQPHHGTYSWGVKLGLKNGQFHYSPDWPELQQANATLYVNQNGLSVTDASGTVYGSPVHGINVNVNDFEHPILHLSADGDLTGESAEKLFQDTPINDILKGSPKSWKITGNFKTHFSLTLPLEGEANKPIVTVNATTDNGGFAMPERHINLQSLKGNIDYTSQNGLIANNIQANFLNHPATLSISRTLLAGKENMTNIVLTGHANFADMKAFIPKPLHSFAQGDIDYKVYIGIPEKEHYFIDIQSNLKGLVIDLPPPFNKSKETVRDFKVLITPQDKDQVKVLTEYGDKVSSLFTISHQKVTSGHIIFNPPANKTLGLPKTGLLFSGQLGKINVSDWYQWYQAHNQEFSDAHSSTNHLTLFANNLHIATLSYKNETLNNITLNGSENSAGLSAELHSDKLVGTFTKKTAQPYIINLEMLKLPASFKQLLVNKADNNNHQKNSDPLASINPSLFPAMSFNARHVLFGDTPYGHMQFDVVKQKQGITLSQLDVSLGGLKVSGKLSWTQHNKLTKTDFQGTLKTDNLNKTFKAFGYKNSDFSAEEATLKVNAAWPASPAGFRFKQANGNTRIHLENGQISAAKSTDPLHIFGLLNIDAIARRLRLDFSDLFDSGISFDTIKGDISFENGLIDLKSPLSIDGPSSDFTLEGAINLQEKFVDLSMIVTLPVTQNLPIIGLLIGQPVIAGAIYVFDKLIGKTLMKFTSVRYDIVGPLSKPDVTLDKLFSDKLKKRTR